MYWTPLLLNAATLESATFLIIYCKLAGGVQFQRCKRSGCNSYFFSNRTDREYCSPSCRKKQGGTKTSELTKRRRKLKEAARRRVKQGDFDENQRDQIINRINSISSMFDDSDVEDELETIELEYQLGAKRSGRKKKDL